MSGKIIALDTVQDLAVDLGALQPAIISNGGWVQETKDAERFMAQSIFAAASSPIELSDINGVAGRLGIMESFCVHARSLLPNAPGAIQFLEADGATLSFSNLRVVTYDELLTEFSGGRYRLATPRVRRHYSNR